MLKFSQLPTLTFLENETPTVLPLASAGGPIQWLAERVQTAFPAAQRLGLLYPTSPQLVLTWLAVLHAGKQPCILQYPTEKISKDYWRDSIQHTLRTVGIEGLAHGAGVQSYHPETLAPALALDGEPGEAPLADEGIAAGAVIQLSSGTTGHKKGVRLTLEQLRRHAANYNQVMQLGAEDTIVSWLPLYHDMGFIACFVMPLMLGVPVVMMDPITWVKAPGTLFAAIQKHRGTVCYLPNFGFEVMARQPVHGSLASMRHWISCSEPTYAQTLERFCRHTGVPPETVSTCYGMAENVFAISQSQGLQTLTQEGQLRVSCGRPIPGTTVKAVDGELYVKSDTSLTAYVGAEEVRDAEGFYATGDLGAVVDGEVIISGRKRDLLICAGKKYWLNDLDLVAGRIVPESAGRLAALAEVNETLGTETVTFLIERPRFWEDDDRARVAQALQAATGLEALDVHFVPPFFLTKTSSGKINRKKTLADWQAHRAWREGASGEALRKTHPAERLAGQVRQAFPALPVDQPLGQALDSLGQVVMRLLCEDHGVAFDPEASIENLLAQARTSNSARRRDTGFDGSMDVDAQSRLPGGAPKAAAQRVFSILALVDGVKLGFGAKSGFISEAFIAELARELGVPVRVEHLAVPPAPVLLSDLIFYDYFLPRDAGEQYCAVARVMQKIKQASLILMDDEDAFRLRDFCVYPRLSHRFNHDPEADLLGHRLAAYTWNHHRLARELVAGKDLAPEQITTAMRDLSAYLGTPVMKLAFHRQYQAYTQDWDYTQYRDYVSDADYQQHPVDAADIQAAIREFIRARKDNLRFTTGAGTPRLELQDPPHFCSFLMNRQAIDFVVDRYDSFCLAGLPSSVPYLEQQLKQRGKRYFYASSLRLDRDDFDCLLLTGFSGVPPTDKPYFDFLQVGEEGGKPHQVPPEIAQACPSLVAADPELYAAYRRLNHNLVPIGNFLLNREADLRPLVARAQTPPPPPPGTVVVYGPVYARSGFGLLCRGWALALHHAGARVCVVPVDCRDPKVTGDLDDCDLYQLRSLEHTEIRPPVTAIYAYVPIYVWPRMPLPEPHVRILLTTYDSSARPMSPPRRLVYIANQMDQVWLPNASEAQAWVRGGARSERLRTFAWPHDWMDNPILGPVQPPPARAGRPFRFLHVSQFLPRRRLDVLIQAFLEEFTEAGQAELYLKMTYPEWHPVPGQPRRDLQGLIEQARARTGSRAAIIVDEAMGTRCELARLFDSADFYVSADTSSTAPVSEALFRGRLAVVADGWNVELPPEVIVVKNSDRQVPVTPELAAYMPHHRQGSFPAMEVADLRAALRQAFALPPEERDRQAASALQFMRERFSYATTAPAALAAIREAWEQNQAMRAKTKVETAAVQVSRPPARTTRPARNISWCGLQLFYGKIPTWNRELCLGLIARGHRLSLSPSHGPFHVDEIPLDTLPKYEQLADRFYAPLPEPAAVNVSCRWHPIFREQAAGKQVMVSTWWSGAIPTDWAPRIRDYVDEVWVPSRHVRDNFLLSGVPENQVWVMPVGIDPAHFQPQATPYPLQTRKGFKFLFVGETSPRKGIEWLLQAYTQAFTRKDDVCLVIKDINCEDYYGRNVAAELIRRCQAGAALPEIEYVDTMLGEAELPGLYTACDAFVQPFRVASFPLAVLEAMACGLPVITSAYGGALECCDPEVSYLLAAQEVQRQQDFVGHWRVSGPQRHANIEVAELRETMQHVVAHAAEARAKGERARERVRAQFSREQQLEAIEQRLEQLCDAPAEPASSAAAAQVAAPAPEPTVAPVACSTPPPKRMRDALSWLGLESWAGSVLVVAPFYNRSGYGTGARALVAGLVAAGVRVRIAPVDNVEEGIDDCDMAALKALEQTPLELPVAALFFHVPHPTWLEMPLPQPSVRILYTTFDSSAQGNHPPAEWVRICAQMDRLWLMTEKEAQVFVAAGVPSAKVRVIPCPHPWINNPLLPLPARDAVPAADRPFRFLSIAMFLPRRRWDTLIEAFLTEFKDCPQAELYLKVNYPDWHPVAGQPQKDLRALIESLQARTGSTARILVDDALGTRRDLCRLVDSCGVYVSTDTAPTAPVSEALVRGKMAVIPDGYGANLPFCQSILCIPADPNYKQPMTPAMLQYQPHHRGRDMPLLRIKDVRRVLRRAYELSPERRAEMGRQASLFMESNFAPTVTIPYYVRDIQAAFEEKLKGRSSASASAGKPAPAPSSPRPATAPAAARVQTAAAAPAGPPVHVCWDGSFLDLGSLSHVNRQLTRALEQRPGLVLTRLGRAAGLNGGTRFGELMDVARTLKPVPPAGTQVTVRHAWPPNWTPPQSGAWVLIQPWEYGAVPADWVQQCERVDEVWVPSNCARRMYVESGVPTAKVQVVPNGFDPAVFRPDAPPLPLATRKNFKFLFVGGTIHRKGPDLLLQAYCDQFTAADDVCLVIKDFGGQSVYAGQTFEAQIREAQAQPNAPEIVYLTDELPDLAGLYTACDCLVHPYRGEGFGLPVLEAMACGLPVVVTGGGATDDFATDDFAYRLPSQRQAIGREISGMPLAGEGWLLEPDVGALKERLRWVFEHRAEARAKGRAASEHARRHWTWASAAAVATQRLQAVAQRAPAHTQSKTTTSVRKAAPIELPPVAKLGHLGPARELHRKKKLPAAWDATCEAIRIRPYHPEAFLLLAGIAKDVGDFALARRCAQQSRKMAPKWKPARKFAKSLPGKGGAPRLKLELPADLARFTFHASATPRQSPRLTVCLITKNEEKFLGQCLESVRPVADQIVVMDTGSTDWTRKIAARFGAEVYECKWQDDFSAARNAALEQATGDWVLFLDADEELRPEDRQVLKKELQAEAVIAYRLPIVDVGRETEGRSFVPRLFRNAPGLFYVGRIHEQIFSSVEVRRQEWGLDNCFGKTTLLHHGYTQEVTAQRHKIDRNLRLLELAVTELPDEPNLLMNYGLELVRAGRLAEGLEKYREAFDVASRLPAGQVTPEIREALLTQFSAQLLAVKNYGAILQVLDSPLAKRAALTASLHFSRGLALMELQRFAEAADEFRRCLAQRRQPALTPINQDILKGGPSHCLALCLSRLHEIDAAAKAFHEAIQEAPTSRPVRVDCAVFLAENGQPVEGLKLLHQLIAENARDLPVWQLGGRIALSRPEFLEFANDWTSEAHKNFPDEPLIIQQRAEALLLTQKVEEAAALWDCATVPASPRVLAARAICGCLRDRPCAVPADQEREVSGAFLQWYRALIAAGAAQVVGGINDRLAGWRQFLPTAGEPLEQALLEANRQIAV